jgi:hypothetical protein
VVVIALSQWLAASFEAYEAGARSFWGLGTDGLVTVIVVFTIVIVTTVWLINGTKKRD